MPTSDGDYCLYVGNEKIPIRAALAGAAPQSNLRGIRPICPHCGECWAKLDLSPRKERAEYTIARWPCGECWDAYHTPGSLWRLLCWWDHGTPPTLRAAAVSFSPAFLRRELLARCAQILGLSFSDLHQRDEAPSSQSLDCEHSTTG